MGLFCVDEYIDYMMLQCLEVCDGYVELLVGFGVFQCCGVQCIDQVDCFCVQQDIIKIGYGIDGFLCFVCCVQQCCWCVVEVDICSMQIVDCVVVFDCDVGGVVVDYEE